MSHHAEQCKARHGLVSARSQAHRFGQLFFVQAPEVVDVQWHSRVCFQSAARHGTCHSRKDSVNKCSGIVIHTLISLDIHFFLTEHLEHETEHFSPLQTHVRAHVVNWTIHHLAQVTSPITKLTPWTVLNKLYQWKK